jgi:hypothetical protein
MSATANMQRLHLVLSGAPRPTAPGAARKYDADAARIEKHNVFYAMLGVVPPPPVHQGMKYVFPFPPPSNRRVPSTTLGWNRLEYELSKRLETMLRQAAHPSVDPADVWRHEVVISDVTSFVPPGQTTPLDIEHPGALRVILKWAHQLPNPPSAPVPSLTSGYKYDINIKIKQPPVNANPPLVIRRSAQGLIVNTPRDLDSNPDLRVTEVEIQDADAGVIYSGSYWHMWEQPGTTMEIEMIRIRPVPIAPPSATRVRRPLPAIAESEPHELNCVVAVPYAEAVEQRDKFRAEIDALPRLGKGGRPPASECTPEAVQARRDARKHRENLNRCLSNCEKVLTDLVAFNATLPVEGIDHGDNARMQELLRISKRNAIEIWTPFSREMPAWVVENPTPVAKIHGVITRKIKVCLYTPGHVVRIVTEPVRPIAHQERPVSTDVEVSSDGSVRVSLKVNLKQRPTFMFASGRPPIELDTDEMCAMIQALRKQNVHHYEYSGTDGVPNKIEVPPTGNCYVLTTPYTKWAQEAIYKWVRHAHVFADHIGEAPFVVVVSGCLLTGRVKFPLYELVVAAHKATNLAFGPNEKMTYLDMCNIDQSKAYTRGLVGLGALLSREHTSIGKISEAFAITSAEQTRELLWAHRGGNQVEGMLLLCLDTTSSEYYWDFSGVTADAVDRVIAHIDSVAPGRDTSAINAENIIDVLKRFYTTSDTIDHFATPPVLPFIEARFLDMCGVRFTATAALVSYDATTKLEWTEASYAKHNGISHYAKAVGAGMRTNTSSMITLGGSNKDAQDLSEQITRMAEQDGSRFDCSRIKVSTQGPDRIQIDQPKGGISTTAHVSAYVTSGQRVQAILQTFLIPPASRVEVVTDGLYCVLPPAKRTEDKLMPYFKFKGSGPDAKGDVTIPYTTNRPSLSRLRGSGIDTSLEKLATLHTQFAPRCDDLLGPFSQGGRPRLITGAAGSGKTTALSRAGLVDVVVVSPTHFLRRDLVQDGRFTQTMCHARWKKGGRLTVEGTGRDLERKPAAVLFFDESTMLTQGERLTIEKHAERMGGWPIFGGDFDGETHAPMQCAPVKGHTMNTEGLTSFHVDGVRRTSDDRLKDLCTELRAIGRSTFGGKYIGGDATGTPPNAIATALTLAVERLRTHLPTHYLPIEDAVAACEPWNGDVILCSTRQCHHCNQQVVEKCFCHEAKTSADIAFVNADARAAYRSWNKAHDRRPDCVRRANSFSSLAYDWARAIAKKTPAGCGVVWRSLRTIRGTDLVNGSTFVSDATKPEYGGVDLTASIGLDITQSPASTIHAYQGITYDGPKLFIDTRYMWSVEQLYVSVSRLRSLDQLYLVLPDPSDPKQRVPTHHNESAAHLDAKWIQARRVIETGEGIPREEYPIGDGRVVADLVVLDATKRVKRVIEVVATNPPTDAKLAYYAELGLECTIVDAAEPYASGLAGQVHHEEVSIGWLDAGAPEDVRTYVGGFKPAVKYWRKTTADGTEYGRAYARAPGNGGMKLDGDDKWRAQTLAACPKAYRKKLAGAGYVDVDIVGAAPCILAHLASTHKVQAPFIRCLARETATVRKLLAEHHSIPVDEAKKRLNMTLHGAPERDDDHDFVVQLRADAERLATVLSALPEYAGIMATCADHERPLYSFLAKVWQTIEHECLMAAWAALHRDPRCVFIFDGMLVPKATSERLGEDGLIELLERATCAICPVRWAVKAW